MRSVSRAGIVGALITAASTTALLVAQAQPPGSRSMVERYLPDATPNSKPLYAPMVRGGGALYLAGKLGFKPGTRELAETVEEQTKLAIEDIEATLKLADAALADVVQCTVYLGDIEDYGAMNGVYKEYFSDNPPARTALAVAGLPLGAKVEIACIAFDPNHMSGKRMGQASK